MPSIHAPRPAALPPQVVRMLRRLRRRLLLETALGGLGWTAAVGGSLLLLALLLDRHLVLSVAVRITLTAVTFAVSFLAALTFLVRPLARPWTLVRLARLAERRVPVLSGTLLSAVELSRTRTFGADGASPELLERHFRDAARHADALRVERLVDLEPAGRKLAAGSVALVALGVLGLSDPEGFRQLALRFVNPHLDLPRPTSIALEVEPGDAVVRRGGDVDVNAIVTRGEPAAVTLVSKSVTGNERRLSFQRELPNAADRPIYRARLVSVRKPTTYRIRAGDYRSPPYRIIPADPPHPEAFRIRYRFPPYTGKPPEEVESPRGDLAAVSGTRADLHIAIAGDVARARVILEGGETREANVIRRASGPTEVRVEDMPIDPAATAYRLLLESAEGVSNNARAEYTIRALPDTPPLPEILRPAAAEVPVESASLLEVRYRAEDDLGLARLALVLTAGEEESVVSLYETAARPAPRLIEDVELLGLSSAGLAPGETAVLELRAEDVRGRVARSSPLTLRVEYLPDPPEGAGWLPQLRELELALANLEADWRALAPRDSRASLLADPDPTRDLDEVARDSARVGVMVEGLARAALETAASIELPSPNRRALEGLALRLGLFAADEPPRIWKAAVRGEVETVAEFHGRGAAKLSGLRSAIERIHAAERIEENRERTRVLVHEIGALLDDPSRRAGDPSREETTGTARRLGSLIDEACRIHADLVLLAETTSAAFALAPLARAFEAAVVKELESARTSAKAGERDALFRTLENAHQSLARRLVSLDETYESARSRAATARSEVAPSLDVAERIQKLGKLLGGAEARALGTATEPPDAQTARASPDGPLALRSVILILDFLADRATGPEYRDLESRTGLQATRDLIERAVANARNARNGGSDGATFLEEVASAYRRSEPLRALGRLLGDLSRIEKGEEDLAWKLSGTPGRNVRAAGALSRAQDEVRSALAEVAAGLRSGLEAELAPARDRARRALALIEDAGEAMEGISLTLGASRGGQKPARSGTRPDGDDPSVGSEVPAELAPRAHRAIESLAKAAGALEESRSRDFPDARAALRWLLDERGSVVERLLRLAKAEAEHQRRVKALLDPARDVDGKDKDEDEVDARTAVTALAGAQEVHRRTASALAGELRPELPEEAADGVGVARRQAARALRSLADGPMLEAARMLRRARVAAGGDSRNEALRKAAELEARAAAALRTLGERLLLGEDEALRRLAGEETEALLAEMGSALAKGSDNLSLEELAQKAALLEDAARRGAEELANRLPASARLETLISGLAEAALRFAGAAELARQGRREAALEALDAGLARFRAAVEAARALRGEALDELHAIARDEEGGPEGNGRGREDEDEEDLAELRAELEKLLQVRRAEKEVEALLEELLGEDAAGEEDFRKALAAQRKLEETLGADFPSSDNLLELVERLLEIDRTGREIAEDERYLEEKARERAAAGRAASDEEVAKQDEVLARTKALLGDYSRAGAKLSAMLPRVWKAYEDGVAAGSSLTGALEKASELIRTDSHRGAAEAIGRASVELGLFLAAVDRTRRRALEAIAEADAGSIFSGLAGLEEARRRVRASARLLAAGETAGALSLQRAAGEALDAARGFLGRQLARGAAGDLGSPPGPDTARGGALWSAGTRGEEYEEIEIPAGKIRADMAYPEAYAELVRRYLRLLEIEARQGEETRGD